MGHRVDWYNDPNAPPANSLVPGGSALVTDEAGRILLQHRADSGNWSLPGGVMEIGETLGEAVVREVREEFSVTFTAQVTGGTIGVSDESTDVWFVDQGEIGDLPMHDTVRLRIRHHVEGCRRPYIG